jgi:CelD/BcsL family acetyltransferase involved in cellulose biosynthesis
LFANLQRTPVRKIPDEEGVLMDIVSINSSSQLDDLEEPWNRLAEKGLYFVPLFAELREALAANKSKFRLLTAVENSQVIACACFIYMDTRKTYEIAWKRLGGLPVRMVVLFGSCVVGEPREAVIQALLSSVIKEGDFDLLSIGNVFIDAPLYRAATTCPNTFTWTGWRKQHRWWLIRLPSSFDHYLATLHPRTRLHINRDCRRFERHDHEFRLMRYPEEVEDFVRDAEKISRLTYHWDFDGVRNDERTRNNFVKLAKSGNLRCYISYVDSKPCAFGWGELTYRRFNFRQTGYDPSFQHLSPGTALIMQMIRDLITNTDCEVFDFLWGGPGGYKARFANASFPCTSVQVAILMRPYSLLIAGLDVMLNSVKKLLAAVIERGPLSRPSRKLRREKGVQTF